MPGDRQTDRPRNPNPDHPPATGDATRAAGGAPLLVIALGGNALSPPTSSDPGYGPERACVANTLRQIRELTRQGYRLLIVHGNGPQVGRLMAGDPDPANFDIHTAQTQGELGWLIASGLPDSVAMVTRVVVDADTGPPVKAIGPRLPVRPDGVPTVPFQNGWRRIVPSPIPREIVELAAIRDLLRHHHVIAGGGGGIAVDAVGRAVTGVVDKDRTAALLAIAVDATHLLIATDVDGVYEGYGTDHATRLSQLSPDACDGMVRSGVAAAGSMGPKLESAAVFTRTTGRRSTICALADLLDGLAQQAGTHIIGGNDGREQ